MLAHSAQPITPPEVTEACEAHSRDDFLGQPELTERFGELGWGVFALMRR